MEQRLGRPCGPGDLTPEVLGLAEQGARLTSSDVGEAWERVREAMSGVPDWWDTGFDLLVTPVTLEPAWRLGEAAPAKTGMFCAPFSFTGQPALVVPATMTTDGLPVGAQIVGRHGDDELLLDLGATLEQALGWTEQRPPNADSRYGAFMIRVTVSYPSSDTSTFDHDYYLAKHIPLMASTWKPLSTSVDKGLNGPNAGAVHCTFETMDDFNAAMGDPGTGAVIADVANYTNIAPVIQVSEIVG